MPIKTFAFPCRIVGDLAIKQWVNRLCDFVFYMIMFQEVYTLRIVYVKGTESLDGIIAADS